MIDNTSKVTKADLEFIIRKSKYHKHHIKRIIMLTACLVLCLGWGTFLAVIAAASGKWDWVTIASILFMLVLAVYVLLTLFVPEKLVSGKLLRHPAYKNPRHIFITEDGAIITAERSGIDTQLNIGFDKMEGYLLGDGAVYIRLITEEKPMH